MQSFDSHSVTIAQTLWELLISMVKVEATACSNSMTTAAGDIWDNLMV